MISNLINANNSTLYGNKASNIAKLLTGNFLVPNGIVIPAYFRTNIGGNNILDIFLSEYSIYENFIKNNSRGIYAVRSSSSVEDGKNKSFPGQFDTYLNVSEFDLISRISDCWNSLNNEGLESYIQKFNLDINSINLGVIIQDYIIGDFSGTIFTANPITGNKDEFLIEAKEGTCENLVSGSITPNSYIFSKTTNHKDIIFEERDLNLDIIFFNKLKNMAIGVEHLFKYPQDIEWTIKNNEIYVLQSRPITTLKNGK